MPTAQTGETPIHKIAFTYQLNLPARWMVGVQQFKRKLARAGVQVPVICVPLETLPADVDLVFVPLALAQQVQARLPAAEVIPLATFVNAREYDAVLNRIVSLAATAQRAPDEPLKPFVVRYRGDERIGS